MDVEEGSKREPTTDDDREALGRALTALRKLDRTVLELVSTQLTVAASISSAARTPDEALDRQQAFLHLARVAYVIAHEGTRG